MKVQLSFEFLLYVGIAMASMAAMLGLYIKGSGPLSSYSAQAEMEGFVADVNANLGVQHGSFYANLPGGLCSTAMSNGSLSYMNQTYAFDGNISMEPGSLCGGAGLALVHTELLPNGTLLVS